MIGAGYAPQTATKTMGAGDQGSGTGVGSLSWPQDEPVWSETNDRYGSLMRSLAGDEMTGMRRIIFMMFDALYEKDYFVAGMWVSCSCDITLLP